jgi:hypothetical protein
MPINKLILNKNIADATRNQRRRDITSPLRRAADFGGAQS